METNITLEFAKLLLTFFTSFIVSSGFWTYISKKNDSKDSRNKLLMGLAHDRIVSLGLKYICRGWVTQDEYENLCQYLYQPYIEMGGNGAAKRLMLEVDKLPIKNNNQLKREILNHDDE